MAATQLEDGSNDACNSLWVDEEDWNNWESVCGSTLVGFFTLVSRVSALLVNVATYNINVTSYMLYIQMYVASYIPLQVIG